LWQNKRGFAQTGLKHRQSINPLPPDFDPDAILRTPQITIRTREKAQAA